MPNPSESTSDLTAYRSRITPWCIVYYPPQLPHQIIACHRKRSDAEAQLQLLRQLTPSQTASPTYALIFDLPPEHLNLPDRAPQITPSRAS